MRDNPHIDTNKEYARVIAWSPAWSKGALRPQVSSNGNRTFLVYYIHEHDPLWDGTYTTAIDPASGNTYSLALVEFTHAHSHRFGIVNDETADGHHLYEKSLEVY